MRLLVVEYEKVLREALVNGLKIKEYAVDAASDGEQADVLAYTVQYDLIILDVNLPIIDGFTVLKNIRRENKEIPVLILSALDEIEDKVKGLDLGAGICLLREPCVRTGFSITIFLRSNERTLASSAAK